MVCSTSAAGSMMIHNSANLKRHWWQIILLVGSLPGRGSGTLRLPHTVTVTLRYYRAVLLETTRPSASESQ